MRGAPPSAPLDMGSLHRLPVWTVALVVAGTLGCSERPSRSSPATWRQALERAEALELQLVGVPGDSLIHERIGRAARSAQARTGRPVRIGSYVDQGTWPRIVVGASGAPEIAPLLQRLGFEWDGDALLLGSAVMAGRGLVLDLCVADPTRPGFPLQLLLAADPEQLAERIEDLTPRARPGLVLSHKRLPPRRFDTAGRPLGPEALELERAPFELIESTDALALLAQPDVDPARLERYETDSRSALARVLEWTGAATGERLELLAVASVDRLRAHTDRAELTAAEGPRSRRVVLLAPGVPDDRGLAAARWAVAWGVEPADDWWLDGLAVDAVGQWWGRALVSWGGHLRRAGLMPSPAEIVDPRSVDRLSQHVLAPARGLLSRFLRSTRGEAWTRLVRGEEELVCDDDLRLAFEAWLGGEAFAADAQARARAWDERRGRLLALPFQTGVAIDSNARLGGGFDDRRLEASLVGAVQLGADAVSITSDFAEVAPEATHFGGRLPAGRTSLEGDATLAQAVACARRAGARVVVLQPHLLLSESAGHSAWLRRATLEHWEEFFTAFAPMLTHYALLAELLEVDLLCVGTNLSTSNKAGGLDPETREHHDRRWGELLALARGAYGGALTYAAGGADEAEGWAHWEPLDYLGVSLFPRFATLNEAPPPTPRLRHQWGAQLDRLGALAAQVDRPLLLVEVGLRSTERAGTETTIGSGAADGAEQARLWGAFAAALDERRAAANAPAGVYLWKWPARPGEDEARGWAVRGKPAEPLLRALSGEK